MRLSSRAEYGTRALIELGLSYPHARPLMLQRIAETQHISKKYLEQIFALLREADLVRAVKGPTGGYLLSRSPEQISLDQVLKALEGSLDISNRPQAENPSINPFCATCVVWRKVNAAIQHALGGVSIADLIQRHQAFAKPSPNPSTVVWPVRLSTATHA